MKSEDKRNIVAAGIVLLAVVGGLKYKSIKREKSSKPEIKEYIYFQKENENPFQINEISEGISKEERNKLNKKLGKIDGIEGGGNLNFSEIQNDNSEVSHGPNENIVIASIENEKPGKNKNKNENDLKFSDYTPGSGGKSSNWSPDFTGRPLNRGAGTTPNYVGSQGSNTPGWGSGGGYAPYNPKIAGSSSASHGTNTSSGDSNPSAISAVPQIGYVGNSIADTSAGTSQGFVREGNPTTGGGVSYTPTNIPINVPSNPIIPDLSGYFKTNYNPSIDGNLAASTMNSLFSSLKSLFEALDTCTSYGPYNDSYYYDENGRRYSYDEYGNRYYLPNDDAHFYDYNKRYCQSNNQDNPNPNEPDPGKIDPVEPEPNNQDNPAPVCPNGADIFNNCIPGIPVDPQPLPGENNNNLNSNSGSPGGVIVGPDNSNNGGGVGHHDPISPHDDPNNPVKLDFTHFANKLSMIVFWRMNHKNSFEVKNVSGEDGKILIEYIVNGKGKSIKVNDKHTLLTQQIIESELSLFISDIANAIINQEKL